jgi:hypothetical protein
MSQSRLKRFCTAPKLAPPPPKKKQAKPQSPQNSLPAKNIQSFCFISASAALADKANVWPYYDFVKNRERG